MKTVFVNETKTIVFASISERLDSMHTRRDSVIMIGGLLYEIDDSFIEIENNEARLLVIVHEIK